tara:strand:- start:102 stop:464 length:363 start_codon:yes stop_codon:yes gene_type:complete
MVNTLLTVITHGSKSRVSDSKFHSRKHELDNNNDSRNYRGNNDNNLRIALNKWSGDNITHTSTSSGGIADSDSVFNMTTAGSDFTLEIVTRAASQVLEVQEIDRTIETTATTTSLSVFSQ